MKYYHTLDPDEIREMEEQDRRDLEDYARAAELLAKTQLWKDTTKESATINNKRP